MADGRGLENEVKMETIDVRPASPAILRLGNAKARHILLAAAFIVGWELLARALNQPAKLPGPWLVAHSAVPLIMSGELLFDAYMSLKRVLLGFVLAVATGIPIGVAIGLSRRMSGLLSPGLELLRPIPAIAMLPIFLSIFGIGEALSVSIVYFAAVFAIIVNTQGGVRQVVPIFPEAARTLGARDREVIREVMIPAALPMIFNGLRLGLQFGWMSIIGAEFIGATNGLGYMILVNQRFLVTDNIVVGMATIGFLGFLIDKLLLLARGAMLPWLRR
jgi:sulfonate transport system permease protein